MKVCKNVSVHDGGTKKRNDNDEEELPNLLTFYYHHMCTFAMSNLVPT